MCLLTKSQLWSHRPKRYAYAREIYSSVDSFPWYTGRLARHAVCQSIPCDKLTTQQHTQVIHTHMMPMIDRELTFSSLFFWLLILGKDLRLALSLVPPLSSTLFIYSLHGQRFYTLIMSCRREMQYMYAPLFDNDNVILDWVWYQVCLLSFFSCVVRMFDCKLLCDLFLWFPVVLCRSNSHGETDLNRWKSVNGILPASFSRTWK